MTVWRNLWLTTVAGCGLWLATVTQPNLRAADGNPDDNNDLTFYSQEEAKDHGTAPHGPNEFDNSPVQNSPTQKKSAGTGEKPGARPKGRVVTPAPTAGEEAPPPPPVAPGATKEDGPKIAATVGHGDPIVIVYKGQPYTGWYLGSDNEHFTFKMQGALLNQKETILTFTWNGASTSERKMLYRQFGIEAVDDTPVYGNQLEADKVTLKNGMIYYGFVNKMNDATGNEKIHFSGAQIKLWILAPSEVAKIEKVKVYESQVYSNEEIYTRHKYEGGGLKNAADNFKMAEFCTKLYLPDEGLEHLEMAEAYDERYGEKDPAIAALKEELKDMSKRKAGDEMVRSIDMNYNEHEFGTAVSLCDRFLKLFPEHPKNTYVQGVQAQIKGKAEETNSGQVVQEIYSSIEDMVREKVASKAVAGVVMPGKRVVGNGGQIWEGAVKEETPDYISLDIPTGNNDTRHLKIHKNNVKSIVDIDLNKNNSAKQYPGYQDVRQWVDGDRFAKDLFERVAKKLNLPQADVEKYWKERTSGEYEIDKNGNMIAPKDFSRMLTVDVGSGTFLLYKNGNGGRGGNRQSQLSPAQQNANQQNSSGWSRNGRQVQAGGGNGGNGGQQAGPTAQDIQPLNDTQWWDAAAISARVQATMGMVALKFLEPKSTTMYNCPVCGGNGYLVSALDATGKAAYKCCPNCNGNLQLAKLVAK